MNRKQRLLIQFAEECSEVSQRVSKALLFGLNEIQEGQYLNNAERITNEVNDFLGILKMLLDEKIIPEPNDKDIFAKKDKVEKYMKYSKELGILKDDGMTCQQL